MPRHPREEVVGGLVLETSEVEAEEGVDEDLRSEEDRDRSDTVIEGGNSEAEQRTSRLTSIVVLRFLVIWDSRTPMSSIDRE